MKAKGLLVLDAHKNPIDILFTGIWLRKKYPSKNIYFPVAAYLFYIPIVKQILNYYAIGQSIKLIPVYRKSDKHPNSLLAFILAWFYPKSIQQDSYDEIRKTFMKNLQSYLDKERTIILISPFGGYSQYGKNIKFGVLQCLSTYPETICTITQLKWSTRSFQTKYFPFSYEDINPIMLRKRLVEAYISLHHS